MILGLVAAASLAGCDVTGTATIRVDDYVDLDLRAVVDGNELCYWQFGETVRTEERRLWRGRQRLCLLQGTVHKEELRRWGVSVSHLGERIEVEGVQYRISQVSGHPRSPLLTLSLSSTDE